MKELGGGGETRNVKTKKKKEEATRAVCGTGDGGREGVRGGRFVLCGGGRERGRDGDVRRVMENEATERVGEYGIVGFRFFFVKGANARWCCTSEEGSVECGEVVRASATVRE